MFNTCSIMGRLSKDVQLNRTSTGRSYMHNTIACDREGTGRGDREKITDWIDITLWGTTAEFVARNFKKGDPIMVSGSIRTTSWTDRNGNKRWGTEVNVDNVYFCAFRRRDDAPAETPAFTEDNDGTDLPFTVGVDDDGKLPWEEGELPL